MRAAPRWIAGCAVIVAAACAKGGAAGDDLSDDTADDSTEDDSTGDDSTAADAEPHDTIDADTADAPPDCTPTAELCNGVDDDCDAATPDGADETWFDQPCDGADVDTCNEGTNTCSGAAQMCTDATGDSNVIVDGSFEDGTTGWTNQSSTNFGTPLCDLTGCGDADGTAGPRTGSWWAWFGGIVAQEIASVSQSVVIPSGVATLTFYFEAPSCDGYGYGSFRATIDGTNVFSTTDLDASCGVDGYVQKTVVVSSYADGASHSVGFTSSTDDVSTPTNFMVDDVRLVSCP